MSAQPFASEKITRFISETTHVSAADARVKWMVSCLKIAKNKSAEEVTGRLNRFFLQFYSSWKESQ